MEPCGHTSVGSVVNITHLAATPLGMRASFQAELLEISGRRLRFRLEAWDEVEKIAEGESTLRVSAEKHLEE